ncbi:outer membrane beta-barrel protein [bacterium]|nr:outer membrane beta-barrel protein [bacterium]
MKMGNIARGIATGAGASVLLLLWATTARGELVFENSVESQNIDTPQVSEEAPAPKPQAAKAVSKAEDRENTRQVLEASNKMKAAAEVKQVAAPVPAVAAAPVAAVVVDANASANAGTENLSRSELLRRERLREELKNEDLLQERLEELRLKAEQKRTDQVLATPADANAAAAPGVVTSVPMKQEVVGTPAPVEPVKPVAAPATPEATDTITITASSTGRSVFDEKKEDHAKFSFAPRIGISNFTNAQYFDIRSRFATGVDLGVIFSKNTMLEFGYGYSEYGLATGNTAFATPYIMIPGQPYQGNFESKILKQNTFEAGVKVYVTSEESTIRPYIGGGAAYGKSFLNYRQDYLRYFNSQIPDYELSQFLGYIKGGLEIKLSKTVSVGADFKFYKVFSYSENNPLNPWGFAGGSAYMPYGYAPSYGLVPGSIGYDPSQAAVARAIADSSFYSILGSINFTF